MDIRCGVDEDRGGVPGGREPEEALRRVSDSILANEALTEGLDDARAGMLIDRALAELGRILVSAGSGETPESIDADAKTIRRFMRTVSVWVSEGASPDGESACVEASGGLVRDVAGLLESIRAGRELP